MRLAAISAALGLAASAAGCNQVFGIEGTGLRFDGPEIDGAGPSELTRVQLVRKRAVVMADGSPTIETEAIGAGFTVRVGPATVLDDTALLPTTFVEASGWFEYARPVDLAAAMRAVITAPGEPPLDVFFTFNGNNVTIPYIQIGRDPVAGPVDDIVPSATWLVQDTPASSSTIVMTTGSWLETTTGPVNGQAVVPWNGPITPLGDTVVAPSAAAGDLAVILRTVSLTAGCSRETSNSASFEALPQDIGASVTPLWSASTRRLRALWEPAIVLGAAETVTGALGTRGRSDVAFGYLPNLGLPLLMPIGADASAQAEVVPLLALLECDVEVQQPGNAGPAFSVVDELEGNFVGAVRLHVVWNRAASGVTASSGMDLIIPTTNAGAVDEASIVRMVAFATAPTLMRDGVSHDLRTEADGFAVGGTGPMTVAFTPEVGRVAEFWSITLVTVSGGVLVPVRVVLTTAPEARFDTTGLTGTYGFVIRGHVGTTGAVNGHYDSSVLTNLPRGVTTLTPRLFVL